MNNRKVSVLMTVLNAENFLTKSINSILIQSYRNLELIIVDDYSIDNSKKLITKIKDKRIKKYFLKKHVGRTKALNFGLSKCKGKYIAILDADDIANKDRLKKQINFLQKSKNYQIVGSNVILIDKRGNKIKKFYIPNNFHELNKKILFKNYLPHSSIMFKKMFLKKTGLYPNNLKYAQDYGLILKFALKTKIYILNDVLVKCRILKNSMTYLDSYSLTRDKEKIYLLFFSLRKFNLNLFKKFVIITLILKSTIRLFYNYVKIFKIV